MAYTPTVWKNGEFPPIDAERLNKIEQGIANSAPGGFGLGSRSPKNVESWDDATANGFYMGPAPSGFGSGSLWGFTSNLGDSFITQTIYTDKGNGCVAIRFRLNNVWQPWEWVNPPMELGVEYRTTERYNEKPVYVQLVDLGACPSSGYKDVVLADETIRAIRCTGRWSFNGGSTVPFYSTNLDCLYIGCLGHVVRITTGGQDFSNYTAQATVHYIKTTD